MQTRWLILSVLFLARATIAFQFQSVAAISPSLISDLKLDYAQFGLLVGVYMLPGVVVSVPGGMLGARFGDKTIALSGLALMILGGIATALANEYGIALAGRLVSGIGAVLLNVLLTKMATDWFAGREIVLAMAILVTSWPFGIGIALVVEPAMAAAQSWSVAVHATAVAAFAAWALVATVYRPARPTQSGGPGDLLAGITARELVGASVAGLIWAIYNVSYILLVTFSPPLLVARGLSAADAGLATSLATWTLMVSVPVGGLLIERTGRPMMLIAVSLVLMAMAIALVAILGESRWAIALAGLISGIPAGAIMALPTQVLMPQNRGAGMGVFFTWHYLAMALFPAIAGLLRDVSGDPRMPLLFAAGLGVVTVSALGAFAALTRSPASPEAVR
jgi:MFS family permease